MTDAGLVLEGVSAGYRDARVLHRLDLEVHRGELLVVLGPSGAGKSTLLRLVAGLHPVAEGRVLIQGRDVTTLRPGRRNVSMVFQSYALFPHLSALDNITFGLEVRDVSRAQARERARAAAASVGCAHLLDRRPGQLSGGERQRVALARALVREPDLFLFDEPLSNLDPELRVETRGELKALHARLGVTSVHVTHDQTEALVMADRIAVLRDGRLEQLATPDEIWREPATVFVARFIGSPAMNLVPADGPIVPHGMPSPPASGRLLGFRPEAVRLTGSGTPGTVERVDVVGEDAYAYVRLADHVLTARVPAVGRPQPGEPAGVSVSWPDVHVFDAETGRRVP
ncbi:ABC transporter ATP-binding protein [Actinoplanes sp. NPDC024001]|uniref:ABC transporter ATP-binding protein n=1 Tax=Actinoplanes sp. NPDC024001 TaxID=3154598 RepID=UPI0034113657